MNINPDNTISLDRTVEFPVLQAASSLAASTQAPNITLLDKLGGFDQHNATDVSYFRNTSLKNLNSTIVDLSRLQRPGFLKQFLRPDTRKGYDNVELGSYSRIGLHVLFWVSSQETVDLIPPNTIRPSQIEIARMIVDYYNETPDKTEVDYSRNPVFLNPPFMSDFKRNLQ